MLLSQSAQEALRPHRDFTDHQLVYFRLVPSEAAVLSMDEVRLDNDLPRTFRRERFHVTLVPLGDIRLISAETMKRILLAAQSLEAEPFPLAFYRLDGNVLRGKGMTAAKDFQHALVRRLEALDVPMPDYDFDPHVSLAYTEWRQRNVAIDPIGWTANEFTLVNSIHGKGPASLGGWPLVKRQGELF